MKAGKFPRQISPERSGFWTSLRPQFDRQFVAEAVVLGFTEQAFKPFFLWLDRAPEALSPESFLGDPIDILGVMFIGLSVDYGIFIVCAKISPGNMTSAKALSFVLYY